MSSPSIPSLTDWHGAAQLHPYFVCDGFTSEPLLQGNQLGVFVDGRPFTTEQMQSLARKMNFAETVFLLPPREGGDVSPFSTRSQSDRASASSRSRSAAPPQSSPAATSGSPNREPRAAKPDIRARPLRGLDFGAMPMVTQSTDRYVYYRP
jgi:hypothetical protein